MWDQEKHVGTLVIWQGDGWDLSNDLNVIHLENIISYTNDIMLMSLGFQDHIL